MIPETTGVDIDVPESSPNPLWLSGLRGFSAASMLTPGAAISGYIYSIKCDINHLSKMFHLETTMALVIITLRMAGETELGPLDENTTTFAAAGGPVSVVAALILTVGDLCFEIDIRSIMFCMEKKTDFIWLKIRGPGCADVL